MAAVGVMRAMRGGSDGSDVEELLLPDSASAAATSEGRAGRTGTRSSWMRGGKGGEETLESKAAGAFLKVVGTVGGSNQAGLSKKMMKKMQKAAEKARKKEKRAEKKAAKKAEKEAKKKLKAAAKTTPPPLTVGTHAGKQHRHKHKQDDRHGNNNDTDRHHRHHHRSRSKTKNRHGRS